MRVRLFFLIICIMLGLPAQAQTTPDISSFTTSFSNIGRQALENRTARIPLSWTTVNRPITANLVFEQVFADGSVINVELPRLIPWVNSNGDGIAAPILPAGNPTTILLRVSLVSLFNGRVLDTAEITLPIVEGGGGAGIGNVPTITAFTANASSVDLAQLEAGTARIPVSWTVINRLSTSQLYFEQVFSNGSYINVELPRPFAWVNSSDSGVVAPRADGTASTITLRLRLVDLLFNRVLDQRFIILPVQSSSSTMIRSFTSTTTSVNASDLQTGNVRIDVAWNVQNRPNNTNLVFEQVLPNGTSRNAELPRDVLIVPSSGNGLVAPIMPSGNPAHLVFQLRIVDLGTNQTLEVARLEIPIIYSTTGYTTVTGDACYRSPFAPSQGVQAGGQGRIQRVSNGSSVTVWGNLERTQIVTNLNAGATFSITGAPHCQYYNDGETQISHRRWPVTVDGRNGWVDEYNGDFTHGFAYNFVPSTSSDIPSIDVISFTVSPVSVDASALDSTYVTFSWQTVNARHVFISGLPTNYDNLATSGSLTILARDLQARSNPSTYTLTAQDSQYNYETVDVSLSINSNVSIRSFTASNMNPRANSQVTFTWDIAGDFESAYIWYSASIARPTLDSITTITSNTGSYTFTLPDWVAGSRQIVLSVTDESGTAQTSILTLNIACAYDWGMSISDSDCPRNAVVSRTSAYQTFQRGFMVWLPVEDQSLWVFYNDGTVVRYYDSWDGNAYTIDPAPPDGLFAPERGFGYLWNTTPDVRSGLGWATAGEQSYTAQYQQTLSQGRYDDHRWYLTLPDGRLITVTYRSMQQGLRWE